jgi:hypothetical protein
MGIRPATAAIQISVGVGTGKVGDLESATPVLRPSGP